MPDSLRSIHASAFRDCHSLDGIIFPSGLESLGTFAFRNCSGMTAVVFPTNLSFAGIEVFRGCTALSDLDIPDGVARIGSGTFVGCTSLKAVTIPAGIASLGQGIFESCPFLTEVHFRPGVTSIAESMFRRCSSLTYIELPASLDFIGDSAFLECEALSCVLFFGDAPRLESSLEEIFGADSQGPALSYFAGRSGFDAAAWSIAIQTAVIPEPVYIESISLLPDGAGTLLRIPTACGRSIGVEYSPDLSVGSWRELGSFFPTTHRESVFRDPDLSRQAGSGYYRAFLRE